MSNKILDYVGALLLIIAIVLAIYQMSGATLPLDPNVPPIIEPRYR